MQVIYTGNVKDVKISVKCQNHDCGFEDTWSIDNFFHNGTPICPECDSEMELYEKDRLYI